MTSKRLKKKKKKFVRDCPLETYINASARASQKGKQGKRKCGPMDDNLKAAKRNRTPETAALLRSFSLRPETKTLFFYPNYNFTKPPFFFPTLQRQNFHSIYKIAV